MLKKVNIDEYLENKIVQDILKKARKFFEENANFVFSQKHLLTILKKRINPDYLFYKNVNNSIKGVKKIVQLLKAQDRDFMLITNKNGYYLTTKIEEKIQECDEKMAQIEKLLLSNEITIRRREILVEEYYFWRDEKVYFENKMEKENEKSL